MFYAKLLKKIAKSYSQNESYYGQYGKEFYVKNVYNFIWKLNIVVDSTFNFLSVFTPEVEFKYNY